MKTFFIETHGCQMNEYDSENVKRSIKGLGFDQTSDYKQASLILINTCNIREKASEKLFSRLGEMSRIKHQKIANDKYVVLGVLGCVAQAEGENIQARMPLVDIVAGPQSYHLLGEMVKEAQESGEDWLASLNDVNTRHKNQLPKVKTTFRLDFEADEKFDFLAEELQGREGENKPSSFVTIQEGCNHFCTYCVVPYTRGEEVSRSVDQILKEVLFLRDNNTKEIVLLGQNVNAFDGLDGRGKRWSIAQLISQIAEIDGIERIRYTTSHPNSMAKDLIAIHGAEPKLSLCLNLPVQSGSNAVLKAMNRKYTFDDYIEIIQRLRSVQPNIVMSSDFIVAFPEETDEDFEQTLELIKIVNFQSQCFSFKFSPRPGTPAAAMKPVPREIASERLSILQDLLEKQRREFNESCKGKTVSVLFDNLNTREEGQIAGRTEFNQIAVIKSLTDEQKQKIYGTIVKCCVNEVLENTLVCSLIV